jgi:micrococcal nuclease
VNLGETPRPPAASPGRRARWIVTLSLLFVAAGCAEAKSSSPIPPGLGTVVRAVDGDTIIVELSGRREDVRLIGIDTPESVARDRPVECYGPEAKVRMAELLPEGAEVRLERDVEARDRYDRLLAYVIRADDGLFVNLALVAEGYAEANRYPPNLARQAELEEAEAQARAAERGLWPVCGGTDVPIAPPPG